MGDLVTKLPEWAYLNLADENGPQAQAYKWDLADPNKGQYDDAQRLARYALASFYFATSGANWTSSTSWLNYDVTECNWFTKASTSVCSDQGVFDNLDLSSNNLDGYLPDELALMPTMWIMQLSANPKLSGSLPTTIGLWPYAMVLDLHDSKIGGVVPTEIGNMAMLAGTIK